jgi:hypothetical protein
MSTASPKTRKIFTELAQESVQVIQQALDSLEREVIPRQLGPS